jgi:hypothetical protein
VTAAIAVDVVDEVATALRAHNTDAIVVDTREEAADTVLGLTPDGTQVHSRKSKTLEDIGLYAALTSGRSGSCCRPRPASSPG